MSAPGDDVLRLYLVVPRRALSTLEQAAALAGAAAVACVRDLSADPAHAVAFAAWRRRPRKVCVRARPSDWHRVLEGEHALAGDPERAAVAALPPRPRAGPGELLHRLQAMAEPLEPPPVGPVPVAAATVTYVLNPRAPMSSGKTLAQVAHAAVAVADGGRAEAWVGAGCPARLVAPPPEAFAALEASPALAARVVDAGLTELAPGTVTVIALLGRAQPTRGSS